MPNLIQETINLIIAKNVSTFELYAERCEQSNIIELRAKVKRASDRIKSKLQTYLNDRESSLKDSLFRKLFPVSKKEQEISTANLETTSAATDEIAYFHLFAETKSDQFSKTQFEKLLAELRRLATAEEMTTQVELFGLLKQVQESILNVLAAFPKENENRLYDVTSSLQLVCDVYGNAPISQQEERAVYLRMIKNELDTEAKKALHKLHDQYQKQYKNKFDEYHKQLSVYTDLCREIRNLQSSKSRTLKDYEAIVNMDRLCTENDSNGVYSGPTAEELYAQQLSYLATEPVLVKKEQESKKTLEVIYAAFTPSEQDAILLRRPMETASNSEEACKVLKLLLPADQFDQEIKKICAGLTKKYLKKELVMPSAPEVEVKMVLAPSAPLPLIDDEVKVAAPIRPSAPMQFASLVYAEQEGEVFDTEEQPGLNEEKTPLVKKSSTVAIHSQLNCEIQPGEAPQEIQELNEVEGEIDHQVLLDQLNSLPVLKQRDVTEKTKSSILLSR